MIQYVYDIVAAVILIAFIGRGFKRGVLRTVLSLICMIIAFTAAAACSSYPVTSKIYDDYFSETVNEHIDSAVKEVRDEASKKIKDEAMQSADSFIDDNLGGSDELKQLVRDYLGTDDDVLRSQISDAFSYFQLDISSLLTNQYFRDKIDIIASEYSGTVAAEINSRLPFGITVSQSSVEEIFKDTEAHEAVIYELLGIKSQDSATTGAANYLEKKIVRPTAIRMIGTIVWVVVFSAVSIVLRIVVSIVLIVRKIEPVKTCDSLLGGVLGAAVGAMVVVSSVILIVILVRFTGGMTYMNEDIFSRTLFFGRLYDLAKGFSFLK
ncbi:MAG: CvpA family protein [Oscillospiraceae bacterium]|nr:CvpA family protein [Oscillospiraceae bacterium]